jgi:pyruvate dehydrogenase E1 component alpha subunit
VTRGILGANGIVGGGIPIALGAAFASKYQDEKNVTVCFFGEGATDEGAFHESMNIAAVMNLPIVFVCENNKWAEFTPQSVHMKIKKVSERAQSYGIEGVTVPNEFLVIYETARKAVTKARKNGGPTMIEIECDRWYGHFVGDAQKYRAPEDVEKARKKDCIAHFEEYLKNEKIITSASLKIIRQQVQEEINAAVEYARQSPMPNPEELMNDLWA